jgi:hypothetical protein
LLLPTGCFLDCLKPAVTATIPVNR